MKAIILAIILAPTASRGARAASSWAGAGGEACQRMAGVCRRSFGGGAAALAGGFHGVSGDFTTEQLQLVTECLGPESVAYFEPDGKVYKAEGPPQVPEDSLMEALWEAQQSFGEEGEEKVARSGGGERWRRKRPLHFTSLPLHFTAPEILLFRIHFTSLQFTSLHRPVLLVRAVRGSAPPRARCPLQVVPICSKRVFLSGG